MASLESRENGSWRVIFRYKGRRHSFTIPNREDGQPLSTFEAETFLAETETRLRFIKRHLLTVFGNIETFLAHRGNPPGTTEEQPQPKREYTLSMLRDNYFASRAFERLSETSKKALKVQFSHLTRICGEDQALELLLISDIQRFIDKRSSEKVPHRKDFAERHISPNTIKLEIKALRTSWRWAQRMDGLTVDFPIRCSTATVYEKTNEALPFMTLREAQALYHNREAGPEVFDAIYLTEEEVHEILSHVLKKPLPQWVRVMFVIASHTGARRSEMLRILCNDVTLDDADGGQIRIRENKRDPTKVTFRTAPLTPLLRETVVPVLRQGQYLLRGQTNQKLKGRSAQKYFHKALAGTPWEVLRGWHTFRHTFRSLLTKQGIDERLIDGILGHCTEEQRRRYRHLYPKQKDEAVRRVFGNPVPQQSTLEDEIKRLEDRLAQLRQQQQP